MLRDILKKTSVYSVAMVASRAMSFLLLPIYTRYLTPGDYGVMELLDLTVNLTSLLIGGRLGSALFYFYFAAENREEKEKCINAAFFGSVLLGAMCAAISLFGATFLSQIAFGTAAYARYFRLVFFGLGFSMPVEVGYCCMRTFGESVKYVRANLAFLLLNAAMNVLLLVVFRFGVSAMLVSSLFCFAAMAVYMTWYVLGPIKISVDFGLLWRLVRYSIPLGVSGIAVFFVHYGDRIFLRPRITLDELGVYSLAYKIGMIISFVHAPFVLHWNSQVRAIVKAPGGDKVYVRTVTYLTAALSLIVVVLSVFIQPVLHLMVTTAFYKAGVMVPWLAAAYLIRSLGAHLQSVFTAEGKPDIEARANVVGAFACFAAYALLIPLFKLWGAVAATLAGFSVILIYSFWEAQRLRRFSYEYNRLLRIAVVTTASICGFFMVSPSGLVAQCGVAALFTVGHVLSLFFGCFDRDERNSFVSMIASQWVKYTAREAEARAAV
jgi:O-antigen/teichoic acid export membrane protein